MRITRIQSVPISFRVPEGQNVRLGIGRAVKRDAVLVKVETDEGLVGWGEAHHGRCPGAIAKLIDTTLSELVLGMDPLDVNGVWARVYRMQLASHGMGAAAAMALSGLDIALWDIRGKAAGWPIYRLLGGAAHAVPAYAGGISLGWQEPASLADEARAHVAAGYRAVKLRVGDSPRRDIARVEAVREALGADVEILVDANTGYSVDDVRRVMPAFEAAEVAWLEEPFPPQDVYSYGEAAPSRSRPARTTSPATSSYRPSRPAISDSYSPTCRRPAASPRRCGSPPSPPPGRSRSTRTPRPPASTWWRRSTCSRPSTTPATSRVTWLGTIPSATTWWVCPTGSTPRARCARRTALAWVSRSMSGFSPPIR